jgi:FKBP-type peptidyl-prolyl cis-trans isomerase
MKPLSIILLLSFLIAACTEYPGYKKFTTEIYYSLIQFDDQGSKALPGDYVTIKLEYRTHSDSVFFSGIRKVKLKLPTDNSSIDHCFLLLNKGDSASFIIPAKKFFSNTLKRSLPGFIRDDEKIKINIRMLEIQTEKEFLQEKQLFLSWSAEMSEYENRLLKQFIREEKSGIEAKPEGFYMITLKKGNGRKVAKGEHIWLNYEGKFLNGKFFDGTTRSKEPIDFTYGTQFILISGLEQALSYMTEGESAMIILPSDLAFGEKGDEFGIIPPYTSLVYTMELVKIE